MFCNCAYGLTMAVGLSQSGLMVLTSVDGSLDTALWNFVSDSVTWLAANTEVILQNHVWGSST
jgi:hypothetical protein